MKHLVNIIMGIGLLAAVIAWSGAEFLKWLLPSAIIGELSTAGFVAVLTAFGISMIAWGLGLGD